MHAFDPNDYRKRVLAAVERRGGIEQSDPFELYDIPLEEAESLGDAEVVARIEEVWGFWQRQRDHPKYRVLVGLLVDEHERRSELLRQASSRRAEATRIRHVREQRDAERYEMLDTAIGRLVQRHGGVPAGKVGGLEEIGAMGGLSAAEVAARLRRHRVLDDVAAPPTAPAPPALLTEQRRKQIRQLLAEWDRLLEGPSAPTLFALLGLDTSSASHTGELRLRAEALRARSRELPAGRVRVVLDELLVHVQDLLTGGGPEVDEYVRAVVEDVTAELRPKVRAAVLVEDELVGEDYEFLLEEAVELGLHRGEAIRLLTALATDLGARVGAPPPAPAGAHPPGSAGPGTTRPPTSAGSQRRWEEPLKSARAALRGGRPQEAAREVAHARQLDHGGEGATPIRSVADEVERVLAEAAVRWRSIGSARAAKRYVELLGHVDHLRRTAADVPPPTGQNVGLDELRAEAERAVAEADRQVAAARSGPDAQRTRALLAARDLCTDHEGVAAALADTTIPAPGRVSASRSGDGSVRVSWAASGAEGATYRVTRLQPDGSWRVIGRTPTTELEDGGAPAGAVPVYAVAAAVAGQYSEVVRTDAPPPGRTTVTAGDPTASAVPVAAAVTSSGVPVSGSATASGVPVTVSPPEPNPPTGTAATASPTTTPEPAPSRAVAPPTSGGDTTTSASGDGPNPGGIATVTGLGQREGRLVFTWPTGVTEVYVVVRADAPPGHPADPAARSWKVTNMRYEIDGGVAVPADLPRPCHVAVASCRREPNGSLTVAPGFAPDARLHWTW